MYCKQSRGKYGPLPGEQDLYNQEQQLQQELKNAAGQLAQTADLQSLVEATIEGIIEEAAAPHPPESEPTAEELTEEQQQLKAKKRNIKHRLRCGCIVCRKSRLNNGPIPGEEGMEEEDRREVHETERRVREAYRLTIERRRQQAQDVAAAARNGVNGAAPVQQTPPPPVVGGGVQSEAVVAGPAVGRVRCTKAPRCPCSRCSRKRVDGIYTADEADMLVNDKKRVAALDAAKARTAKRRKKNDESARAASVHQAEPELEDLEVDNDSDDSEGGAPPAANKNNCSIM